MSSLIRNSNQTKQGIDSVLEFDNEALILMEVKKKGNKIPTGQRLVLERIANSWHTNKSVVLYVTHSFKNDNKDIPLSECNVDSVYINKEWKILNKTISLSDTLSVLGKKWNINKLKK